MPEYRRAHVPGGTFFLTLVTCQRVGIFASTGNINRLRQVIRLVRRERPFEIVAAVVLPDHLHLLWTLPEGDSDFSRRVGRIKALFTQSLQRECPALNESYSPSRQKHREASLWQRRFWEHTIRDEADLRNHLDYIHYNPVRHGLVNCPHAWKHSSFHHWVNVGGYEPDWCCICQGAARKPPYSDIISFGE
ncbi:MAG: transposase [Phycisphaerales bacterium]|nr:transposase [Phycisphaerales bacterium]